MLAFVFLTQLLSLCQTVPTNDPLLVSGSIAEKIAQRTRLVEGVLKLEIRFTAPTKLYGQLVEYELHLKDVINEISQYKKIPLHIPPTRGNSLPIYYKLIQDEIRIILSKITNVKTFNWINTTHPQTHTKRGAFDFGGIILSNIFGLASEGDLKLVQKKVDVITEAIKNSNTAILTMLHDHNEVIEHVKEMQDTLNKYTAKLDNSIHEYIMFNRLVVAKAQIDRIEKLVDFLAELDFEITNLITGAQGNSLHLLPKSLFPYDLLLKINMETEEQLQMKSVAPLAVNSYPYYINTIRVFPGKDPLSMMLIIPYASDKSYDTFKFHPFPTFYNNFTKHRVLLNFRLPYMLLSTELKTLTHLSSDDFRLCSHNFIPESTLICFISHPLYSYPLTDSVELEPQLCQESIVRKRDTSKCSFTPYMANDTVVLRIGKRIYLSSVSPIQAVVNCPSGNSQPLLKELTVLAPGCSFTSKGVSLNNYLEVHGDLLVPISAGELPIAETLDFSDTYPIENSNTTPKIILSEHNDYIQTHIKQSEEFLKKADSIPTHAPMIISGTTLIFCLIVTLSVVLFWYLSKRGGTSITVAPLPAQTTESIPLQERPTPRRASVDSYDLRKN